MPKGPVETPITDQEIEFAHLILEGKLTDREAAEAVGISPGQAAYVKAKPRVKTYMEEHRASVRDGLVQHEVDALAPFNIGREQIMARLHELGMLPPERTNGNIIGQVKALDSLWKALGFEESKKPEEEEPKPEPPNYYKASWLLERERGIFSEREENPEPALSSPEAPPAPEPTRIDRPAGLAQSSTARPVGNTMNHGVETQPLIDCGAFGRFQR
jgi:hypothetical protein